MRYILLLVVFVMTISVVSAEQGPFKFSILETGSEFLVLNWTTVNQSAMQDSTCSLNGDDLTLMGDLDVAGNITGNLIYGEMWFNNDTSNGKTTSISSSMEWTNISGWDQTGDNGGQNLNGVQFLYENSLRVIIPGIYKLDYSISFERLSGGATREFEIGIMVDGVIQNKTIVHRSTSNVNDVGSGSNTGFVTNLNNSNNLHLMIRNMGGNENIGVHNSNVNILRIGN